MKKNKDSSKLIVKLSLATIVALTPTKGSAQSLNCFDNLIFGEIMTCGTPGTVTIQPDNSISASCVSANAPYSRARCVATQSFPFRPMQIEITPTSYTITNGTASMSVTDFNIINNGAGPTAVVTAPFVNIPIGATLNVGGTQAAGTYNGTFIISVILQ